MNLVKVQKNKSDNTLTLDIISASCKTTKLPNSNRFDELSERHKNIFKFSFVHQLSDSTPSDSPFPVETTAIHAIRLFSLIWLILVNVVTVLSYTSSKFLFALIIITLLTKLIFRQHKIFGSKL
jgi:hypothetical protein